MRTQFYTARAKPARATQGILRKILRPKLSKEARIAISARRRLASKSYRNALEETWKKIDNLTADLAVAHHKSLRRVQSELHMGSRLSRVQRKKTNVWNAFCWKKAQDKENGLYFYDHIGHH